MHYDYERDLAGKPITPGNVRNLPTGLSGNIYGMYRAFVFQRHRIWTLRQEGEPAPWAPPGYTFLNSKKFTNVFRVLDPGSQYVVEMLQEPGLEPRDALARAILYRFTNRPETWEWLKSAYGRWPVADDMNADMVNILHEIPGGQIFSGAYIIMPTPGKTGDKALAAVALARRLTARGGPENVVEQVVAAKHPRQAYEALRSHVGMGDFMSMQILTDWGYYWPEYSENEFVQAGPGSTRGVAELFRDGGSMPTNDVLRRVRDDWWEDISCPTIPMPGGLSRAPSLMDVQNTFCEFFKYMRYIKKESHSILKPYEPAHPGAQPKPLLPHHWRAGSGTV